MQSFFFFFFRWLFKGNKTRSGIAVNELPCETVCASTLLNRKIRLVGITDTGSSGCLLCASATKHCGLEFISETTALGFGNSSTAVAQGTRRCQVDMCRDRWHKSKWCTHFGSTWWCWDDGSVEWMNVYRTVVLNLCRSRRLSVVLVQE